MNEDLPVIEAKPRLYWEIVQVPYQMGPQKHRLFLLDTLAEKKVKSLLDVGCGTGPIYQLLIDGEEGQWDSITKYKGVDYAPNFIKWAQDNFGQELFQLQDARSLLEKDNSWDCVLLMHSLDHIREYDKVIKEAARVSSRYVCVILWRAFRESKETEVHVNDRNMFCKEEGEEPWEDTYLMQYPKEVIEAEFKKNGLIIEETGEGEVLNSGQSKYNFMYLLRKIEND